MKANVNWKIKFKKMRSQLENIAIFFFQFHISCNLFNCDKCEISVATVFFPVV